MNYTSRIGKNAISLLLVLSLLLLPAALAGPATRVAAAPAPGVGNEYFQQNLEIFPDLYDPETNKTRPIFSNANDAGSVIVEQVWVEAPIDTDYDGKRDLLQLQIRRPIETETLGLKVPVLAIATPYQSTTAAAVYHPFNGRAYDGFAPQGLAPQRDSSGRFSHLRYPDGNIVWGPGGDLSYAALRYVMDEVVGIGPNAVVARHRELEEHGMLDREAKDYREWHYSNFPWLPPARTPKGTSQRGEQLAPTTSFGEGYFAPFLRNGYAVCRLYIVGANHSEGMLQFGSYAECLAAASMVDWLNGRVRAYADPEGTIEVKAYWATGAVAMGGTSYNGTLALAAGVTGVEGLRTIIPAAPVTNAYNYYLANSMMYAPGGFAGEQITSIIAYCFGRGFASSGGKPTGRMFPGAETWKHFWGYMSYTLFEQDADQGDYSPYYDERNLACYGDDMRKDLGVIMMHGFNDNNVRFKQTALLNEMLRYYGIEVVRGAFSRNAHAASVNADGALIAENMHEWMDYYLYGIENGVVDRLPNYSVQSSINSTWKQYSSWPAGGYQRFYPTGGKVGALSAAPQDGGSSLSFKDVFQLGLTRPDQATPSPPAFVPGYQENAELHAGHGTLMAGDQFLRWKNYITGGNDSTASWSGGGVNMLAPTSLAQNWTKVLDDRLLFIMDVPEEMTISGTIKMTAEAAADKNYGALSAMVLDIGSAPRTTTGTIGSGRAVTLANGAIQPLNFHATATAPYAIVSRGSVDIRNPNPDRKIWIDVPGMEFAWSYGGNWNPNYLFQSEDIVPGEFHSYTWELDVTEYTIRAGHKLAVILYGSDPEYTYLSPNAGDVTEFTVNIGPRTYLSLPIIGQADEPHPAVFSVKASEKTAFRDKTEYIVEADDMQSVNLIELTFEMDGGILSSGRIVTEGLNGFQSLGDPEWTSLGNNKWQCRAILGIFSDQTMSGSMEVAKLSFDSVRLGLAKVALTKVQAFGIDKVAGVARSGQRKAYIDQASATTKVYSVIDADDDGKVGWSDLSFAFIYYGSSSADDNWESAKAADVNSDGKVDIVDLVEIYANFMG